MKTIILAGGYGTRLAEYTQDIPKPMIKIGNDPILTHIMRIYSLFGFNLLISGWELAYLSAILRTNCLGSMVAQIPQCETL